jgi:uncharacterized membrane protein
MNWFDDPAKFQALKVDLVDFTGLAKDAMHVHIGLIIFVVFRLCWRWRGGWILAWLAALTVALVGEYFDIRGEAVRRAFTPDSAHWHDVWNTMAWPTVLMLIGRWLHPRPKILKNKLSRDFADQTFEQAPPV